jgi:hypothetical protein
VEPNLFSRRGERPGDLQATFLAKYEPHLARRAQTLWPGRPEGGAGPGLGDRAKKVLVKETVLTAHSG